MAIRACSVIKKYPHEYVQCPDEQIHFTHLPEEIFYVILTRDKCVDLFKNFLKFRQLCRFTHKIAHGPKILALMERVWGYMWLYEKSLDLTTCGFAEVPLWIKHLPYLISCKIDGKNDLNIPNLYVRLKNTPTFTLFA